MQCLWNRGGGKGGSRMRRGPARASGAQAALWTPYPDQVVAVAVLVFISVCQPLSHGHQDVFVGLESQ